MSRSFRFFSFVHGGSLTKDLSARLFPINVPTYILTNSCSVFQSVSGKAHTISSYYSSFTSSLIPLKRGRRFLSVVSSHVCSSYYTSRNLWSTKVSKTIRRKTPLSFPFKSVCPRIACGKLYCFSFFYCYYTA
jgi:hypothetical protein